MGSLWAGDERRVGGTLVAVKTDVPRRNPNGARRIPSAGFTYVWLLFAVALAGVGLAAVGELASTAAKRDKEVELLFVGDQIARAIAVYRASSPGAPQYPQTLEALLSDSRYPNLRRYLRRVYPDPMTGRADWGLVRGPGGGIVGVHSKSTARPLKTANFPKEYEAFAGVAAYSEWRFVAAADGAPSAKPQAPTVPGAPASKAVPASPGVGAAPSPFTTRPNAPSAAK